MFGNSSDGSNGGPNQQTTDNKPSRIFNCNLDSVDSVYEFIKRVYSAITPKCASFPGRLRNYGARDRNNVASFLTLPKAMRDYIFGNEIIPEPDDYEVKYFCDKNLLKRTDLNGKEEIFLLVKIIKKRRL